jgi:hypothetical protein
MLAAKMIRKELTGSKNPMGKPALTFCELVLIKNRSIMLTG